MIKHTIGFLGLLASVMALCSLVYGAFQEPLWPYMQGIMGGILDVYRTMRDALFSGLNWAVSGLVNWAGYWINWLPPTPWLHLSKWVTDGAILYSLIGSSLAWLRFEARFLTYIEIDPKSEIFDYSKLSIFSKIQVWATSVAFWPIKILQYKFLNDRGPYNQNKRSFLVPLSRRKLDSITYQAFHDVRTIILKWMLRMTLIVIGGIIFFATAYAENLIRL